MQFWVLLMHSIKIPSPEIVAHRAQIIAQARQWVGTPFVHQHQARGHGVDCVGLIIGVGLELGLLPDDIVSTLPNYSRTPNPDVMGQYLERYLVKKSSSMIRPEAIPDGAIIWFQWREGLPMHVGIKASYNDRPTLIHSWENLGKCAEHNFSPEWSDRGVSIWDYPFEA